MTVITWTVVGGFVAFSLGLVSAIGSRFRGKRISRVQRPMRTGRGPIESEAIRAADKHKRTAMSMAEYGQDREEELAASGSHLS